MRTTTAASFIASVTFRRIQNKTAADTSHCGRCLDTSRSIGHRRVARSDRSRTVLTGLPAQQHTQNSKGNDNFRTSVPPIARFQTHQANMHAVFTYLQTHGDRLGTAVTDLRHNTHSQRRSRVGVKRLISIMVCFRNARVNAVTVSMTRCSSTHTKVCGHGSLATVNSLQPHTTGKLRNHHMRVCTI